MTDAQKYSADEKFLRLSKKYIFFYIAHDLIFKSRAIEIKDKSEPQSLEKQKLKFSYLYAIGDNLIQWVTHLVLELGESDYIRLNEIISILNIWRDQQIYDQSFIERLKCYILP